MPGTIEATVKQGWDLPLRAKKFHYFRNGRSLCFEYHDTDELLGPMIPDNRLPLGKIKCSTCRNRLAYLGGD